MKVWAKQKGFTIVELLIVIVVIGILAAITIVAYNGIQSRANVQRANTDLNSLVKAIHLARVNQSKTLFAITGSACTACSDQTRYELTLDRISEASGTDLSQLKKGNPWGAKYSIDENEGETSTCTRDSIGPGANVPAGTTGITVVFLPTYAC